jgi:opacity protein-like surface antigen
MFCLMGAFKKGSNRARVFPAIFPALFPVLLWMGYLSNAVYAPPITGFIGLGAGGIWDGGTHQVDNPRGSSFREDMGFPSNANHFAGTITAGLLYPVNAVLFGPYVDAAFIPNKGDPNQLFLNVEGRIAFGIERPQFRWALGLELGYPMDRLTPFARAGFAREKVKWYATFAEESDENTGGNIYTNGVAVAGGLNYALGPKVLLSTSVEMKFFPTFNAFPPSLGSHDFYALKNNNLSFLISARYCFS